MRKLLTLLISLVLVSNVFSQNITITDDNAYTADPSAMLDVKSLTKGFLVPRMTTVQRVGIISPATGLLVYDTNENVFYYYTGSEWSNLSTGQLWSRNGSYVFLSNTDENVGIGITDPNNKLLVKADATTGVDESIFAVLNNHGDTVFAVYQQGVRIWVDDTGGSKANGSRGGFAVGGYNPTKAGATNEYLRVTPDSVRIYIDDNYVAAKANGSRGGFAVGGFNPTKGTPSNHYLFVQDDSTRVYVNDSTAGFGVASIESGSDETFMDMTTENYFIGHESGQKNLSGKYNSFIGYNSGRENVDGTNNVFLGYKSGYANFNGWNNVFIGNDAGHDNTTGAANVYIGFQAGQSSNGLANIYIGQNVGEIAGTSQLNTIVGTQAAQFLNGGNNNCIFGTMAAKMISTGNANTIVGTGSGFSNTTGAANTYIGNTAGYNNTTGSYNVCIGYQAGLNNALSNRLYIENSSADSYNALIYGEFDNNFLRLNADVIIGGGTVTNQNGVLMLKEDVDKAPTINGEGLHFGEAAGYKWIQSYESEPLTLNPLGNNVGVNTTTPDNAFDVNGKISITQSVGNEMVIINGGTYQHGTGSQIFGNGGGYFLMATEEGSFETAGIRGDGDNVAIWSPADGGKLVRFLDEDQFDSGDTDPYNNGAEKAYIDPNGQYFQVSDMTKKQNINRIQNANSKLSALSGYTYEYKLNIKEVEKGQKATTSSGLLAQEIQAVLPEAVQVNEAGELFVNYSSIIPLLVEALKEQNARIEALEQALNKK